MIPTDRPTDFKSIRAPGEQGSSRHDTPVVHESDQPVVAPLHAATVVLTSPVGTRRAASTEGQAKGQNVFKAPSGSSAAAMTVGPGIQSYVA